MCALSPTVHGAVGEKLQKPSESSDRFIHRMQRLAGRNHGNGSLQGVLIGFMTADSWKKVCRKSREGSFPKISFAEKEKHENPLALVRVEIRITGITNFLKSLKYFIY